MRVLPGAAATTGPRRPRLKSYSGSFAFITVSLSFGCLPGRDQPDGFSPIGVNHHQQATLKIHPQGYPPRFFRAGRVVYGQSQGVFKHAHRIGKIYVVLLEVAPGLFRVPLIIHCEIICTNSIQDKGKIRDNGIPGGLRREGDKSSKSAGAADYLTTNRRVRFTHHSFNTIALDGAWNAPYLIFIVFMNVLFCWKFCFPLQLRCKFLDLSRLLKGFSPKLLSRNYFSRCGKYL